MIVNPLISIILIFILVILTIWFILSNLSSFKGISNFNNSEDYMYNYNDFLKTLPTQDEQKVANDEFLKSYNKLQDKIEELEKDKVPYTWNNNYTLDSMILDQKLEDRLTCFAAPEWWYPKDKYDPKNFREVHHGDYKDPLFNYLSNAQDMFWDFKSVKNS